jgi:raffinose/stachyose/melibiose transport system substrate-binding protein
MAERADGAEGRGWFNWLGVAILAVSYAWALMHMFTIRREQFAPDRVVIRFTHWQLEKGIREGLDEMARRFEQRYFEDTGQRITIVQNPISERAYRQYVQTQCIGRTAPDLIEIGFYDAEYTRRFFLSNSEDVRKPNPYNAGTALAGVPWADTYRDGMVGSMDEQTLEYYGAGLSTVTIRLFYNKRLFREVLGTDAPPQDYRDFLRICEVFAQWAKKNGRADFAPIAGTRYQLTIFAGQYTGATLGYFGMTMDEDFDGGFGHSLEVLDAYAAGRYGFDDPAIRAGHEMLGGLTRYFPAGFMAQDRMEAGFRFTQGRAAFITSGAWDAMSYFVQSDFPIGVIQIPLPARDDPEYGRFIRGPYSESQTWAGLRFGITKFCQHPDIALKFLQFMTTARNNEDFNRICKWIPVIRDTQPHPLMEPFMPRPAGFWGADPFLPIYGGRAMMVLDQARWDFVEHKTTFDQFVGVLNESLPRALAVDLERSVATYVENQRSVNPAITWHLAGMLFGDSWGLSADEARKLQSRSEIKLKYLWEGNIKNYEIANWLTRWDGHVKDGKPRALAIRGFVTEALDQDSQ